jgi:LDH2 family malate/lactate/ureidoglycolate dehydrogenase
MPEPVYVISAENLEGFARALIRAAGVPPDAAALTARSLVSANLRGVDSHGVHLLLFYLEQIERREIDPLGGGRVVSETGGCLLYDGGNALGQVVADRCTDHGVRLTRQHGLSLVVARESNHFGAAAFWAQKYSAQGLIGAVFCNASPIVPPWQGKAGRVGTNPICLSVPGGAERPFLLDMATTTVAANRIFKAMVNGQPQIPPGWAMDADGVPTTDTRTAYEGLISPLGGYKGSGLALMVEILCGVLGGGAMATEVGGLRFRGRPFRASQCFLGIDIERFLPLGEFQARMDWLIREIKNTPPAKGYTEVLVAGEPEWRAEERRRREGIPLEAGTWNGLLAFADRWGIAPPALLERVETA